MSRRDHPSCDCECPLRVYFPAAKKPLRDHAGDRPQQPSQVVARRTQHRVQRIAKTALEPAAINAMVGLQVTDDRLHGLTALEPATVQPGQRLVAPPVNVDERNQWLVIQAEERQEA